MAVTGLGYLALMWSTVVLLGGFVTVLRKKDFWCLTVISMTQAARIFNDLAEHLVPNFVSMVSGNILSLASNLPTRIRVLRRRPLAIKFICRRLLNIIYVGTIVLPFQSISYVTACLYGYSGPVVCIALALWRIAQRDYGGGSNGNLTAALDVFYSLVLLQGSLYVLWTLWPIFSGESAARILAMYCQHLKQSKKKGWFRHSLFRYLSVTRARCWRQPASIRGRTLCSFAVELLDSRSWEDTLSGVRLLDAFIVKKADIRTQFLPYRQRIQKLIDALGWRARDMREPASRIVAHLAGDIRLAQFPGAMESISSLLLQEEDTIGRKKQYDGGPNELILQGLAILEGLASDQHNCSRICGAPSGLLRNITAPLSSADLIDDISNKDWANVVSKSFKVLHKLIHQVPQKTSWRLRREICSNKQMMSNLESILKHGHEHAGLDELLMGAMGILTQLTLDPSIDLPKETKENLIKKQLQTFLGEGQEAARNPLREWAGRTLLLLSTAMTAEKDIIGRLTGILDARNTMTCRTIAAHILENLCAHRDLDKQWVKETLLPMVLTEILSSKRGTPENGVSPPNHDETQQISAPGNDEENSNSSTRQGDIEFQEISSTADQNKSSDGTIGDEEQTTTANLMLEAFLSLALVILDKLVNADDFDDAVQKKGIGPGEFVAQIKAIVEDNCQQTAESLRIVKLCWQIFEPMMARDQYAQHFKNMEFVKSLSNAAETMSNLESSMLFSRTDFKT